MSQPSSPASPGAQFTAQQHRSFINLTSPLPSRSHLDPPQGLSYAEFLRNWSDSHVARWLADIKCASYAPTFKAHDIRGDIILDLDQLSLVEMGVATIGDRLRILDAIKSLRLRVQGRNMPTISTVWPAKAQGVTSPGSQDRTASFSSTKRRLDVGRPAPLQLPPNTGHTNLPDIVHDPDSARVTPHHIRPLPQPNAAFQVSMTPRPKLPPAPPPPVGQPPPPPPVPGRTSSRTNNIDRRTPMPSDSATPHSIYSPPESRVIGKTFPATRTYLNPTSPNTHARKGSLQAPIQPAANAANKLPPRPSTSTTTPSNHPYANVQPLLHVPPGAQGLSPIEESFSTTQSSASSSPSPPSLPFASSRPGYSPSHNNAPSLGDLRWKLVKFICPDEERSFTIDVTSCSNGVEVLEKVLRKFDKGSRTPDTRVDTYGGLTIDGWGVFLETGDDTPVEPLTEAELMSICHAPPDHPSREPGLYLRRTNKAWRPEEHNISSSPSQSRINNTANPMTKATKRASAVSVLGALSMRDLEPPISSGRQSPALANARRPSKLRNFFGQRPPSELITNHLSEYFPFTEKKVLQRTARNSMMFRSGTYRDSSASFVPLPSRFSTSTQGSGATTTNSPRASIVSFIPQPTASSAASIVSNGSPGRVRPEELPRVSISSDDGHSAILDPAKTPPEPQLLPPIPFQSESLSDSLQNFTAGNNQRTSRPVSRAMSIASRRMSYMTELRSKRDRSDTASMVTLDEITAEVESRCVTGANGKSEHSSDTDDGWTRVGTDDGQESGEDANDEFDEEDEEDEETLEDDDVPVDAVIAKKAATKWIKGALIGAGSFGKVYLGMDASSGFLMAVKQVELPTGSGPNEERKKSMLNALEREIELLKNLQHDNIVQYLYSSMEDDHLNIFLEYVPGGSVSALLRNYGAFEEPLVKNFARQILEGLNYLHERDIMHRDIKGANILVDNKGGIKISDFGISKKVETNLLGNKMHRPSLQGSVFWMAPEVVKQSGHTKKADIWSVGCLAVEMLTGEHPWAQLTQMQAIFKIGSSERPAIPSDISLDAQDFLQCTFKLDYEARPSAAELLRHPWIGKQLPKP